jgi:hypothetical protein
MRFQSQKIPSSPRIPEAAAGTPYGYLVLVFDNLYALGFKAPHKRLTPHTSPKLTRNSP